jgi:hypothetical protein
VSRPIAAARIALIALALLATVPSTALASGKDVIDDCLDNGGVLTKPYTQSEYNSAISQLQTAGDAVEYSDCITTIRRARLQAAGSRGSSKSGGGSRGASGGSQTAPRKLSKKQHDKLTKELSNPALATGEPLNVGGTLVNPDSLSSSSSIPGPLIAVLVLAALGAMGSAAIAVRRFVAGKRK